MRQQPRSLKPPPPALGLLEARAPFEGLSLLAGLPWLALAPRGDGHPIMLAPGYGAGEASLGPLAQYLRFLGYRVQQWGLGRNRGRVERYVYATIDRLRDQGAGDTQPAFSLIGWSLGGVVMREVAREAPERVRSVITLGTPVVGGPKYTRVAGRFAEQQQLDLDAFEQRVHERNLRGIDVPLTSIYSKTDGIVAWRASVDHYNEHARNVRVPGSHLGLGVNPVVWRIIARSLAELPPADGS